MTSSRSSKSEQSNKSGRSARKRKVAKSFKVDGHQKKIGRTAKGRKVARQFGGVLRELGGMSLQSSPFEQPQYKQENNFFETIPAELRKRILSYLTLKDLAIVRSTCQEFHGIVAGFEDEITRPKIAYHIGRLQKSIDAINATQMPTDAESFLHCLRIWTSIRGSFYDCNNSLHSYNKWFSHLAGGKLLSAQGQPEEEFQRWSRLAAVSTVLQCRTNQVHAHNLFTVDENGVDTGWRWFRSEMANLNVL